MKKENFRDKKGKFKKGFRHTKESREKMSKSRKGIKFTKEWRENLSKARKGKLCPHKGHPLSEKTKRKLSEINKGKKLSEETKRKIGEANKGIRSWNWKGGISLGKNRKKAMAFYQRRRESRRKGSYGSHTFGELETLKAQYNWTCPCCKKQEPEIKLTEDHIIPLSKGGSDNIENIQPLCFSCNSKKNIKIIRYEKT